MNYCKIRQTISIRELPLSNLRRSNQKNKAYPERSDKADKSFETTKNLEAERDVPDKAAAAA